MKPTFWFIPPLVVSTAIFLLSTVLSVSFQIDGVSYTDKLSHSFAYFALTITLLLAFYKNEMLRTINWQFLIIACSAYGILLEFVQYGFFPNRYFEWLDAIANVSGALIGGFTFRLFKKANKLQA